MSEIFLDETPKKQVTAVLYFPRTGEEEQVPQASAVLYFTPRYCGRRAGPTCYCCTLYYHTSQHLKTEVLSLIFPIHKILR